MRGLELGRWVASCATGGTRTPAPVDVLYMPTAADVSLWEWVCDYNRRHPADPILLRGMDVWDRPWEHVARIESLAVRAGMDPALVDRVRQRCPVAQAASWPEIEALRAALPGDHERCRLALTAILNQSQQLGRAGKTGKRPGADEAFELAISASTLLGWLGFHHYSASDDVLSWKERDRAQGRNLMLFMEQHGAAKAILSAHTSHVSHNRSPADWWGSGDLKSGVFFFEAMRKVFNIGNGPAAQGDPPFYDGDGRQVDRRLAASLRGLRGHHFSRQQRARDRYGENVPGRRQAGQDAAARVGLLLPGMARGPEPGAQGDRALPGQVHALRRL